jgi:peptidoglycan/xylan/chitin deacetylase (PgdA/CDA1 family)
VNANAIPRGRRSATVTALVLVALMLATASTAAAETRVVITIDVESKGAFRLPAQVNAVCTDGSACGLMEIARLLRERGWAGTFFLNVYEHRQLGETAMRDIAVGLRDAGQDVALHTHPDAAYDPARSSMHQYTLEEQTTIVKDGVRLLQSWTGQPVVAHRAGAYAADEHTLLALDRNGILVDSSLFWQAPDSRLDALGLPRNLPSRYGRLTEIPVTVYQRDDTPTLGGSAFAPVSVVRKIDAGWAIDAGEMRDSIDAAVAADVPVIVMFLHSFSLVEGDDAGPNVANRHVIEMFHVMLDQVARRQLQVVTMRDLAARPPSASPAASDTVPHVTVHVSWPRYAWRRAKGASRVTAAAAGGGALVLVAGGMLLTARRRRRGPSAQPSAQPAATVSTSHGGRPS